MDVHPRTHAHKVTVLIENDSSPPTTPYPDHYSALSLSFHPSLLKKGVDEQSAHKNVQKDNILLDLVAQSSAFYSPQISLKSIVGLKLLLYLIKSHAKPTARNSYI